MNKTSGSLHITRKVDYGLFLLAALADEESSPLQSIKKIAEESKISFPFLQKVARLLQKSRLIKASRGKYGGYRLSKVPKDITLKDVVEALDGEIALTPCLRKNAGKKPCQRMDCCNIRSGMTKINHEIKNALLSKTLDQIIA